MPLETPVFISDLVATNPPNSDLKVEGAVHLRNIKSALKTTFPNVTGAVTTTQAELNQLAGSTSAIQAQLNTKAPIVSPVFTVAATLPAATNIGTVTAAELLRLSGVSSAIQTQINTKAPIDSPVFTGVVNLPPTGFGLTEAVTKSYADGLAFASVLPAQLGNAGKIITTNGVTASWQTNRADLPITIVTATTQTAVDGNHYVMSNAALSTLTLPAAPANGVGIDVTFANGRVDNIVARNGSGLMVSDAGIPILEDLVYDVPSVTLSLVYAGNAWRFEAQGSSIAITETIESTAIALRNATETAALLVRNATEAAALLNRGYEVPVTYATAISLTRATQTVSYLGVVYAPTPGTIPFTTSGTFETAKFRVITGGVLGSDLAASGGAGLVGFMQSGTGAVVRTMQSKQRDRVSVKDFGAIGDGVTNDYAAINAALAASKNVFFPQGNYLFSGTLTVQVDSHLHGDGKINTKLTYTGAGTAFSLNGGYTTFQDVFILGNTVAPLYFSTGTRAIHSPNSGGTIVGVNIRIEGFETLLEGTGYYWKFYNSAFYKSKFAFQNVSINNLSFFGCAFSQSNNFINCAPGAGPVSLYGCSIEAWSGVAIANVSGSSIALEMSGCYVENYPGMAFAGTGLGQFINAFLIAGDFQSLSFHGNSVQCVGIRRVLYNTNTTNAVLESSGNLFWYESGAALSSTEYLYFMSGGVSFNVNDAVNTVANAGYGTYTTTAAIFAGPVKNIKGINPITGFSLVTAWTNLTLGSGWINAGNVGFPILAYKVENGLLHLQGQVQCTNASNDVIATLPTEALAKLNCSSVFLVGLISQTTDSSPKRYRVITTSGAILVASPTLGQFDIIATPWPINS